jgi:FkbM family methyltransferase
MLPTGLKRRIHKARFLDRITRRLYGRMVSGDAEIEAGPMQGVKLRAGKHVSHAHIKGTYEEPVIRQISRVVRPGMLCYDLGASIGYISLLMAHKGARQVYAFEPAPHAADILRTQAAANRWSDRITHVPYAASDRRKLVEFGLTDNAYGSRIVPNGGVSARQPLIVQCVPLDEFAAEHGYPDFVKIDIEGEETNALKGATEVLRRKPILCIEIHSREQAEGVSEILQAHRYSLYLITDEGLKAYVPSSAKPGDVHVLAL